MKKTTKPLSPEAFEAVWKQCKLFAKQHGCNHIERLRNNEKELGWSDCTIGALKKKVCIKRYFHTITAWRIAVPMIVKRCKQLIQKCSFKSLSDTSCLCSLAYWLYIYGHKELALEICEHTNGVDFEFEDVHNRGYFEILRKEGIDSCNDDQGIKRKLLQALYDMIGKGENSFALSAYFNWRCHRSLLWLCRFYCLGFGIRFVYGRGII